MMSISYFISVSFAVFVALFLLLSEEEEDDESSPLSVEDGGAHRFLLFLFFFLLFSVFTELSVSESVSLSVRVKLIEI